MASDRRRTWQCFCGAAWLVAAALTGCDAAAIGDGLAVDEAAAAKVCGNGRCNGSETCQSCPTDCGGCPDAGSFADSGALDSGGADSGALDSGGADSGSAGGCAGVPVTPRDTLQALIDANPSGTTFCFAAGTYLMTGTVNTRDKSLTLDFRAGAVLDGQNGGFIGFTGPQDLTRVTYLGGIFQHFGNAASPLWVSPMIVRANDVVDGGEFKDNFNAGLAIQGSSARAAHVRTHHNGRYGLVVTQACAGCGGPVGVIIEDSEIAFNNTQHNDPGNDAGGTKFSGSNDGMIVRRNQVHDNYGSGLWWDGFNRNAEVYGNVVSNNLRWGIFWELSYGGARIHDNTLTNNGVGDTGLNWYNAVQILVSCSDGSVGGIEIYNNTVDGTVHAIGMINHIGHPIRTHGVYVHHNTMILRSAQARAGGHAYDGLVELFAPASNNRFDYNTYRVMDTSTVHWHWDNLDKTWTQWRSAGQDPGGTVGVL